MASVQYNIFDFYRNLEIIWFPYFIFKHVFCYLMKYFLFL